MSDVALLKKVDYFADVDDETLAEIAKLSRRARFLPGERIVSELESGADVFVVMAGEGEVSVETRAGERQVLGRVGPGSAFGEMASITGELRSATVTATGDVEVLRISDAYFDRLRERRPQIAVALVRILGTRIARAEAAIDALLASAASPGDAAKKEVVSAAVAHANVEHGSIRRAWRELVINRSRDLTFLTFGGFLVTLGLVRLAVYLSFAFEWHEQGVLRAAYMTGFALLAVSACVALLTFRPSVRRAVALGYGIGVALIFNSLGVTLAFDIFYKDIHTADPEHPFDIEALYRRTEPIRAIALGLIVLFQAVYLRKFYRRAAFVVKTRARSLFSRGASGTRDK